MRFHFEQTLSDLQKKNVVHPEVVEVEGVLVRRKKEVEEEEEAVVLVVVVMLTTLKLLLCADFHFANLIFAVLTNLQVLEMTLMVLILKISAWLR